MLSGFERGRRRLSMLVPHGDDRHRVDLGISEKLAVVGEGLLHSELSGHLRERALGPRAERRELKMGDSDDRFAVNFTEPSKPDNADA